jgi:hypothetical protein
MQIDRAAKDQKSTLMVELAMVYIREQNHEKAFKTFLEALSWIDEKKEIQPKPEDVAIYEREANIYLTHNGANSNTVNAEKLEKELKPLLSEHPDYYLTNFILAVSYANLGMYQEFMEAFYSSYRHFPQHYMAYKTKAILYIKLYERSLNADEKEKNRKKIIDNVQKAMEKNGDDCALYKLRMMFAAEEEKTPIVSLYLNKIIDRPMIVARADIAFFVHQAVEEKLWNVAQRFIDKAKETYQYSRVVLAAQEFLDKRKIRETNE